VNRLDPEQIRHLLAEAQAGANAHERGNRYESLLSYVFGAVPNTLVIPNTRNFFGAEQVDLAVSNGGAFPGLPSQFLVECKELFGPS
jgi:hypothetical protein